MTPRLVVVVGPTASGKSALAMQLAEAAGGEVLSADSQQVYRGMDIGTAKVSLADRARVRHHLIDVVDPDDTMTAARFAALADAAIADAAARAVPIVVAGGTGLYVRALLEGLFDGPGADPALRSKLEEESTEALRARLAEVDPPSHARLLAGDRVRIVRALEVHALTGRPISTWQAEHPHGKVPRRYPAQLVGLDPPRPELVARIDARVDHMIAAGLADEVRGLEAAGYPCTLRSLGAIGYREMCAHLHGKLTLADAALAIKQATRRYARRQLTWHRPDATVTWYRSPAEVPVAPLAAWLRH